MMAIKYEPILNAASMIGQTRMQGAQQRANAMRYIGSSIQDIGNTIGAAARDRRRTLYSEARDRMLYERGLRDRYSNLLGAGAAAGLELPFDGAQQSPEAALPLGASTDAQQQEAAQATITIQPAETTPAAAPDIAASQVQQQVAIAQPQQGQQVPQDVSDAEVAQSSVLGKYDLPIITPREEAKMMWGDRPFGLVPPAEMREADPERIQASSGYIEEMLRRQREEEAMRQREQLARARAEQRGGARPPRNVQLEKRVMESVDLANTAGFILAALEDPRWRERIGAIDRFIGYLRKKTDLPALFRADDDTFRSVVEAEIDRAEASSIIDAASSQFVWQFLKMMQGSRPSDKDLEMYEKVLNVSRSADPSAAAHILLQGVAPKIISTMQVLDRVSGKYYAADVWKDILSADPNIRLILDMYSRSRAVGPRPPQRKNPAGGATAGDLDAAWGQ